MHRMRSLIVGVTLLTGCTASEQPAAGPQPMAAGHSSTGASSPASSAGTVVNTAPSNNTAGRGSISAPTTGAPSAGTAGAFSVHAAGAGAVTITAGSAGTNGSAGATNASGAGGAHASGAAGAAGGGAVPASGSNVTGKLGALGDAQPILAGWATSNGLETLIYLSSAPLTCEMMMTQGVRWLGKLPAKSQVVEIVVGNPASTKLYAIGTSAALGGGEVNYAEGSKSSSTEVTGRTGSITFTKAMAMGVQEGTFEVTAPYMASGTFHAEWCQGGTEY